MFFLKADRRDTGGDVVACVSGKLINFIGHRERCSAKSSGSSSFTRNDRKYRILAILPLSEVFFKPGFQGQRGPNMRRKVDAGGCVGVENHDTMSTNGRISTGRKIVPSKGLSRVSFVNTILFETMPGYRVTKFLMATGTLAFGRYFTSPRIILFPALSIAKSISAPPIVR